METAQEIEKEKPKNIEHDVATIQKKQRELFDSQKTKDIAFRKAALKRLKQEILAREQDIFAALEADFKKPVFESVLSETGVVISELDLMLKKINSWSKPKRVFPSMLNFPSSDKIYPEPYGATLVIAPWNYPFQLAMAPLIGAVAAGNTVVVKPSELTMNTSKVVSEIVSAVFEEAHVAVFEGGVPVSEALLSKKWDYIFFTGSVAVGRIVAKAAAKHLTPTTLELGGKNPCIVDDTANIKLAARRIVWGKFLNGGQTCIAPDYILINAKAKHDFVRAVKDEIENAYGKDPKASPDLPRIVNEKNFHRLTKMLEGEEILVGGQQDLNDLYIAPTLLDNPKLDSEVMKDEIFGPILPLVTYRDQEDIEAIISSYDKPLSLYVFSTDKAFSQRIIEKYSFGGGAINDTIVHFANHRLPFGGVGNSGIGAYHGKLSFDTFSHFKPVVKRANWLDVPVRYAPYKGKLTKLKTFLKYF
ncbi:aldehyde dehydrogenase [Sungkyunkwania multivorans]|uniref:Aldehyde dehydrogenase n=1 Tax=Sungkyunkwania multivorans TaxID=1173618 RepID=A0ABW3CY02_9FLAO